MLSNFKFNPVRTQSIPADKAAYRMPSPKVSVFIATYNHGRFLPECLDSILAQTYRDFEIVIVDDGSTDNTDEILKDYASRYPDRIRHLWHSGHQNRGVSHTSNVAIANCRGEYLAWIGSDDVWYPDILEKEVALLDSDSGLSFVYGYAHLINATGDFLPGLYGTDITQDPDPVTPMLQYCHPPAMTVMFRRTCLDQAGVFEESLVYSDWELFIRLAAHWKIGFIDKPLAKYRMHGRSLSKSLQPQVNLQRTLDMMNLVRSKVQTIGGRLLKPRNLALVDLHIALLLFCSGDTDGARADLKRAFEQDPSLTESAEFLNTWLNAWKPDYYTTSQPHFGTWVIANIPENVPQSLRQDLSVLQLKGDDLPAFFTERGISEGKDADPDEITDSIFRDWPAQMPLPQTLREAVFRNVYSALLFDSIRSKNPPRIRRYWTKAVRRRPALLLNRGVWAAGTRAFLASRH
jgi:glycosyltransferase involved in cell wall biosynthesis